MLTLIGCFRANNLERAQRCTLMVIDPRFPWKLPRVGRGFPAYPFRMSVAEWEGLLAKANSGDPEAEWEVSERFGDGCKDKKGEILVRRSAKKAQAWLRRAAEHGCASAQCNFGVLLGDQEETSEALVWLKRALRAGVSCAALNIAITYRQIGDLRRAVHWFRKSVASGGDDDALIQLGIHFYWGEGVRKNISAAVRCYRKATKGTNISEASRDDAFFYLAIMYLEGKGAKTSIPKARKLLLRANVDNDHPAARSVLQELTTLQSSSYRLPA